MQFIRRAITFFFLGYSTVYSVVELKTKQETSKIKNISKNGKITYYQKSSGELHVSTNYNFEVLLKKVKHANYNVYSSEEEKIALIELEEDLFQRPNLQKDNELFSSKFGSKSDFKKIGNGVSPKLHLADNWISFYSFTSKSINIYSVLGEDQKIKSVRLKNTINPYFVPQVLLLSPHDILYSDINKTGFQALMSYSFIDKGFKTIHKTKLAAHKLEVCRIGDKLYIGEFPYDEVSGSTRIFTLSLYGNKDLKTKSIIYSSPLNDIGNLVCFNKKLFFVKTNKYRELINSRETSIVSIDPSKNHQIEFIEDTKDFTQLLVLGNLLVSSRLGKNYIIAGENLTLDDEITKDKK